VKVEDTKTQSLDFGTSLDAVENVEKSPRSKARNDSWAVAVDDNALVEACTFDFILSKETTRSVSEEGGSSIDSGSVISIH
jgi:hypothetical protein